MNNENNYTLPFYQPVVSTSLKKIIGIEVLSRIYSNNKFHNPFNSPGNLQEKQKDKIFVEILKKSVQELLVLKKIVNFNLKFVSYNIERYSLINSYPEIIKASLQLSSINTRLIIELVEYEDYFDSKAIKNINMLKEYCDIALDDFGVNQSNFMSFFSFKPAYVKLDKCFMDFLATDDEVLHIIESLNSIFMKKQVTLIVEGVETEFQHTALNTTTVPLRQGFFYSKPVPLHNLMFILNADKLK